MYKRVVKGKLELGFAWNVCLKIGSMHCNWDLLAAKQYKMGLEFK